MTLFAPWNSALYEHQISARIYRPDQNILHGFPFIPHVSREFLSLENTRRFGTGADGTRGTMEHGTVGGAATSESMSFYYACKSFTLCPADNVYTVASLKNIHTNLLPHFKIACSYPEFSQNFKAAFISLFKVSLQRLCHPVLFYPTITKLYGIVTIGIFRFLLYNKGWFHLNHRYRNSCSILRKNLTHPQFFTNNSHFHIFTLLSLYLYIHSRRKIQFHKGIYRRLRRLYNINQSLMGPYLELLPRFFIHMRRTIDAVFVNLRWQRHRTSYAGARPFRRFNNFPYRPV